MKRKLFIQSRIQLRHIPQHAPQLCGDRLTFGVGQRRVCAVELHHARINALEGDLDVRQLRAQAFVDALQVANRLQVRMPMFERLLIL